MLLLLLHYSFSKIPKTFDPLFFHIRLFSIVACVFPQSMSQYEFVPDRPWLCDDFQQHTSWLDLPPTPPACFVLLLLRKTAAAAFVLVPSIQNRPGSHLHHKNQCKSHELGLATTKHASIVLNDLPFQYCVRKKKCKVVFLLFV